MSRFVHLGLRNLVRNRTRTLITLGAIVFGVCGLILAGGFVKDIFFQLGEALIHSQSGHAQIGREAIFTYGSRTPERHLLDAPDALRERLRADPAVKDVMARITFSGLLNNGRTDYAIVGDGIEPDAESRLGTHLRLVAGRALTAGDTFGAMLGEGVADALQLGPGDTATLLVSTIDGAMNTLDVEIVGVFQTFSKDFDARAVRIPLAATQELLRTSGAGKLVVALNDTADTEQFVSRARGIVAGQDLVVLDWQQLNDFYGKTVELYRQQFGFLRIMVLLMVCLSVANTVTLSLAERIWEFGTMRALGNRNRTVVGLILAESSVLGTIGATVGIAAGIGVAVLVSGFGIAMPPPPNAEIGYDAYIQIAPDVIVEAWVTGFFATILASFLPAWRLSRVSIIDALRTRE